MPNNSSGRAREKWWREEAARRKQTQEASAPNQPVPQGQLHSAPPPAAQPSGPLPCGLKELPADANQGQLMPSEPLPTVASCQSRATSDSVCFSRIIDIRYSDNSHAGDDHPDPTSSATKSAARGKPVPPAGTTGSQVEVKAGSQPKADTGISRPKADSGNIIAAPSAALLMSVKDVAKLLGVSVRSVWRMRKRGQLPSPLPLAKQTLRWRREEVEQWIASGQIVLPEAEAAPRASPAPR